MIGTSFPYIEFYPKPGRAKGIQLDIDAARIGLRYPVDVGLVGDSQRASASCSCRCCKRRRIAGSWRPLRKG